jgi:hypothetical protein
MFPFRSDDWATKGVEEDVEEIDWEAVTERNVHGDGKGFLEFGRRKDL